MKKWMNNAFLMVAATAIALLGSCDGKERIDNTGGSGASGSLSMKLNVEVNVETKSVSTDNFIVRVLKADSREVAQDVNRRNAVYTCSTVPEIVALPVGRYLLEAYSHELAGAEWERPYYHGYSDEFDIVESKVTQSSAITCTFKSVQVTLAYTPQLLAELTDDFQVIVSTEHGHLVYDKTESRDGYFKPAPFDVRLIGERHDGEQIDYTQSFAEVSEGEHHTVTLDVDLREDMTGSVNPELLVDITTKAYDVNVNVPSEEPEIPDNPGPGPGPEPGNEPAIVGRGFSLSQPVSYAEGETEEVVVDITAEEGIKDLMVRIESEFIDSDPMMEVIKNFNLADMTAQQEAILGPGGLGLVGSDPVRGSKGMVFDITPFTRLLPAGEHKFHLTLTDSTNQSIQVTLTLKPY